MSIAVGDKVPDVEVKTMGPEGPQTVKTGELLGAGKVVLFAVPGAFTPGCSKIHLPGYVEHGDEFPFDEVLRVPAVHLVGGKGEHRVFLLDLIQIKSIDLIPTQSS